MKRFALALAASIAMASPAFADPSASELKKGWETSAALINMQLACTDAYREQQLAAERMKAMNSAGPIFAYLTKDSPLLILNRDRALKACRSVFPDLLPATDPMTVSVK